MSPPVMSTTLTERQVKVILWGNPATRKTETVLRYFPNVLLFDIEGNADQCVGMDEIPPFMLEETRDVYSILKVMEQVEKKKIKFPDKSLVQTMSFDSLSILWAMRQDVGAMNAETRARRFGKTADQATMTSLDWQVAKRPLRRLHTRIPNLPVRFIFMIVREKDLFEDAGGGNLKKIGPGMDAMKGLMYEANISFHLTNENGRWQAEVDKVQGALGKHLPLNSKHSEFPYQILHDYASEVVTGKDQLDEVEIAEQQHEKELAENLPHTKQGLIEYAQKLDLTAGDVAEALKEADLRFDGKDWETMTEAVKMYASKNGS
jgi:hypothetical protein